MKRKLAIVLAALLMVAAIAVGCNNNNNNGTSPSPQTTMKPSTSPTGGMSPSPGGSANPSGSASPTTGSIPNFSEGTVVDPEDVPAIVDAIKSEYSTAEIRSITHSMYEDKEAYLVMMDNVPDGPTQIYVLADGTIHKSADPLVNGTNAPVSPGTGTGTTGTGGSVKQS